MQPKCDFPEKWQTPPISVDSLMSQRLEVGLGDTEQASNCPRHRGLALVLSNFHLSATSSTRREAAGECERGWKGFHGRRGRLVTLPLKRQSHSQELEPLQAEPCEELWMEGAFNLRASYKSKVNLINLDTLCDKKWEAFHLMRSS